MKREAIANKGIWTGKKHYILNVYNNEGVAYAQPKLKMQGIEAVRSSTPSICRKNFKKALDVIMNQDEPAMKKFVKDFKEEYMLLPFEDIAFPRSVRDMKKWQDPASIYKKSTPIHVKGSLIYNNLLRERNLDNKYQVIRDGDKIKFAYLKNPNPTQDYVISCPNGLPKELKMETYIDYAVQFEKGYLSPIESITNTMGWQAEKRATLEDWFS